MELPINLLESYDAAADYFSKRGIFPSWLKSHPVLRYIEDDPEAFEERIKQIKYAAAMEETYNKNK